MVGRTPEYLLKRLKGREMKLTALYYYPPIFDSCVSRTGSWNAGRNGEGITNPGFTDCRRFFTNMLLQRQIMVLV